MSVRSITLIYCDTFTVIYVGSNSNVRLYSNVNTVQNLLKKSIYAWRLDTYSEKTMIWTILCKTIDLIWIWIFQGKCQCVKLFQTNLLDRFRHYNVSLFYILILIPCRLLVLTEQTGCNVKDIWSYYYIQYSIKKYLLKSFKSLLKFIYTRIYMQNVYQCVQRVDFIDSLYFCLFLDGDTTFLPSHWTVIHKQLTHLLSTF